MCTRTEETEKIKDQSGASAKKQERSLELLSIHPQSSTKMRLQCMLAYLCSLIANHAKAPADTSSLL